MIRSFSAEQVCYGWCDSFGIYSLCEIALFGSYKSYLFYVFASYFIWNCQQHMVQAWKQYLHQNSVELMWTTVSDVVCYVN